MKRSGQSVGGVGTSVFHGAHSEATHAVLGKRGLAFFMERIAELSAQSYVGGHEQARLAGHILNLFTHDLGGGWTNVFRGNTP